MEGRWTSKDIIPSLNLYHFIKNQVPVTFDMLGLVPKDSVKTSLKKLIKSRNRIVTLPKDIKDNECIYFIFYDRDEKDKCINHRWHKNKDNNYISHVAVYTLDMEQALGFNPLEEYNARIRKESRMDIALIKRCCEKNGDISKVKSYLQLSLYAPNAKYYYPIDSNGNYTGKFRWHVNGPNCATFAWNISTLYFGFDKEVDWDYAFLFLGRAHRPEEFRQFLHDEQKGKGKQCKTIYTAPRKEWQGKE